MYSFQWNDKTGSDALLDWVRRGCEKYYKPCADIRLERENESPKVYAKMTNNQKDDAIMLARTGKYTATQIARMIGHTQAAVFKLLVKKLGMTLPDGRHAKRKKATP